ncbi:Oidioi.mRNA.OKI2018_I69.chr2.g4755.t1.cds [Oikopleura dioica]|uniref:Oidioi.mRNA.OKI2018_I69.chr2.g4755.t1.cds n=1 Tax=Oikopleura dioica TaxID=34765 RepID=A0ABN7T231_OIKDI|nr:Oidioi.mRNA.OKI2018_I69.chr2.g4755.t1.cds [Oikopleura dioica]
MNIPGLQGGGKNPQLRKGPDNNSSEENAKKEGNTSNAAGQAVNSALFVSSSKYLSDLLKQRDFCERECFSQELSSLNCSKFLSSKSRNPNQCIQSTLYIPMVIVILSLALQLIYGLISVGKQRGIPWVGDFSSEIPAVARLGKKWLKAEMCIALLIKKPTIDILTLGDSNSCKSTIGHLIFKCGGIDGRAFERIKKREEAAGGKGSIDYETLLSKLVDEEQIEGGNKHYWKFKTNNYAANIIDTCEPDDIKKMMRVATSKVDCALLILSAREVEASFSKHGQIREDARLVSLLGIDFIVCVDDMESILNENRFNYITVKISEYLKQISIDPEAVPFIPISALHGDNIVEPSTNMAWYNGWNKKIEEGRFSGKTLVEALDAIINPKRVSLDTLTESLRKPLRLPVNQVFHFNGEYHITGRVETGVIRVGMDVSFSPLKLKGEVESISLINLGVSKFSRQVSEASIGDTVGFTLKDTKIRKSTKPSEGSISIDEIKRGTVVSDPKNDPAKEAKTFKAEITVLNHPTRITGGYSPRLKCNNRSFPCQFTKLLAKIDRRSNKSLEDSPEFLKNGDTALVQITPTEPVSVEPFKDYPVLGKFTVVDMKQTVGVGVIMEVEKYEMCTADVNQLSSENPLEFA